MSSALLPKLARLLRERSLNDPKFHLVSDGGLLDTSGEEGGFIRSRIMEKGGFVTRPVPPAAASGFTHFVDGVQLWRLVSYEDCAPLIYGYTAAVILQRGEDRCLKPWGEACIAERLFLPGPPHCDLSPYEDAGIHVQNIFEKWDGVEPPNLAKCGQAAMASLGKARTACEKSLVKKWVEEAGPEEWLFVDGSLDFETTTKQVVGVVKSHRTHYFEGEELSEILHSGESERSAAFLPAKTATWRERVCSWYLRLHHCQGKDLTFGLVRVEAETGDDITQRADLISSWLLAERSPLSYPDARWDRLFYPIHGCEAYLQSLMPTRVSMESVLA